MNRSLQAAARSWLPIASAPRDGSNVLIRFGQDGVSQSKYIAGEPHPWVFVDRHSDNVSWILNSAVDGPGGPSHWQPMPDAALVISAQDAADEKLIQAKGAIHAPRLTPEQISAAIIAETFTVLPSGRVTVCELTLRNGFTVRGESAVVSIENFNAAIGRDVARDNARAKVWELEGYLLKQRLFENA